MEIRETVFWYSNYDINIFVFYGFTERTYRIWKTENQQ